MFSKIVESLRSTSTNNNNSNNTMGGRYPSVPDINVERRSSFDEDGDGVRSNVSESRTTISRYTYNDDEKQAADTTTATTTTTTDIQGGGPNAIGIRPGQGASLSTEPVFVDVRRRSSLFGYSRNAADDYMQKDLLSSSWS